jgi:hypothetical protein
MPIIQHIILYNLEQDRNSIFWLLFSIKSNIYLSNILHFTSKFLKLFNSFYQEEDYMNFDLLKFNSTKELIKTFDTEQNISIIWNK